MTKDEFNKIIEKILNAQEYKTNLANHGMDVASCHKVIEAEKKKLEAVIIFDQPIQTQTAYECAQCHVLSSKPYFAPFPGQFASHLIMCKRCHNEYIKELKEKQK